MSTLNFKPITLADAKSISELMPNMYISESILINHFIAHGATPYQVKGKSTLQCTPTSSTIKNMIQEHLKYFSKQHSELHF